MKLKTLSHIYMGYHENMKPYLKFLLVLGVFNIFTHSSIAQRDYKAPSECTNYNAFMYNGQIDSIAPLIHRYTDWGGLYLDPDKLDSLDYVFEYMQLDSGTTFVQIGEYDSQLDSITVYKRYQQYYSGIEVENSGYSLTVIRPGGPGPCPIDFPSMISPYVKSGISVATTPQLIIDSLPSILDVDSIYSAQLVITHNRAFDCEYKLAWRVIDYGSYTYWVDASSGAIIDSSENGASLQATTIVYDSPILPDRTVSGVTTLETTDQKIKLYDFNLSSRPSYNFDQSEWKSSLIPVTTSSSWTTEAPADAYQAFYVVNEVAPVFKNNLGIDFGIINIGIIDHYLVNARAIQPYVNTQANLLFGGDASSSFALFDVCGHEFCHTYLGGHVHFPNDLDGNSSVHEGISDMFGEYSEFILNGSVNWEGASDDPNITARDLSNPAEDCYTDVVDSDDEHLRSTPLGYWFYLISDGGTNIPTLGIQRAMDIVLESTKILPADGDYFDFMRRTMVVIEDIYGICSDEWDAAANAWEQICVPTGYPEHYGYVYGCNHVLTGPTVVYEEDDAATYCVLGGTVNSDYKYTIIGPKSPNYSSVCGMIGNSQTGCSCLELNDFPKYPYYPQFITIEVYDQNQGSEYREKRRVKLVDYNHDDDTCEEYYNSSFMSIDEEYDYEDGETTSIPILDKSDFFRFEVYDILGRLILKNRMSNYNQIQFPQNELLFIAYYNKEGKFIFTEKTIYFE